LKRVLKIKWSKFLDKLLLVVFTASFIFLVLHLPLLSRDIFIILGDRCSPRFYYLALNLSPTFSAYDFYCSAQIWVKLDNLQQAITQLKKAIKLDYNNYSYHLLLGDLLLKEKDKENANKEYLTAAHLMQTKFPDIPEYQNQIISFLYDKGFIKEAKEKALKLKRAKPKFLPVNLILINIYYQEQNYKQVVAIYEEITKLNPHFFHYPWYFEFNSLLSVGDSYMKLGEREKAKNIYLYLLKLNPKSQSVYIKLANLYKETEPYKALNYLNKLIKINPYSGIGYWEAYEIYKIINCPQAEELIKRASLLCWDFSKEKTPKWRVWKGKAKVYSDKSSLIISPHNNNARVYISSEGDLRIDTTIVAEAKIIMKIKGEQYLDTANFCWATLKENNFCEGRGVKFKVFLDGKFHNYTVSLKKSPYWRDIVYYLFLSPGEKASNIQIKKIELK